MNELPKAVEVELKLVLPSGKAEPEVVDILSQNGYSVEKLPTLKNIDIYMDTSDWALFRNKLSLRYRVSNGRDAVYTMKSIDSFEDGIAKRTETEFKLDKPVSSPTQIPVKELKKEILDLITPRKLMEEVVITTRRRRYCVGTPEGARIELAFDTSSFCSDALYKPCRAKQHYELEAEVKEGPVFSETIKPMAALLAEKFHFEPATKSKLATAMESLKIEPIVKRVPEDLKIRLDDRLDLALKKILKTEFMWMEAQRVGAMTDRDPEFVHQARVATRRMRSALIMFHDALPERTVKFLETRLKWVGGLFGTVRDLDVFNINLTNYEQRIPDFNKAKRKAIETLVIKQRRAPLRAMAEGLESRKYKIFEKRMLSFLDSPCEDQPDLLAGQKLIREVAPQAIRGQFKNIVEQSKRVFANPKLTEFHSLRIQMKRLRYLIEFMAPAYGNGLDGLIQQTVHIQTCLGDLQDTVFNQQLVKKLIAECQGKMVDPDLLFTFGEIYQVQNEISRERQRDFKGIWNCFCSEETDAILEKAFKSAHKPRAVKPKAQPQPIIEVPAEPTPAATAG